MLTKTALLLFAFLASQHDIPVDAGRGCEARAHLYAYRLEKKMGEVTNKVFIRGQGLETLKVRDTAGRENEWRYHVALEWTSSAGRSYIFDPVLFKEPVETKVWLASISRNLKNEPIVQRLSRFARMPSDDYDGVSKWDPKSFETSWNELDQIETLSSGCARDLKAVSSRSGVAFDAGLMEFQSKGSGSLKTEDAHKVWSALSQQERWDLDRRCKAVRQLPETDCLERARFLERKTVESSPAESIFRAFAKSSERILLIGEEHNHKTGVALVYKSFGLLPRGTCVALESAYDEPPAVENPVEGLRYVNVDFPKGEKEVEAIGRRDPTYNRNAIMAAGIEKLLANGCAKVVMSVGYDHLRAEDSIPKRLNPALAVRKVLLANRDILEQTECKRANLPSKAAALETTWHRPLLWLVDERKFTAFQDFHDILYVP
ncbi:MAG: protein-glutamine glutaminase family protein [Bdellovibrionia bacterium]